MIENGERERQGVSSVSLFEMPTFVPAIFILATAFAPVIAHADSQKSGFGTLFYSPQERLAIAAVRRTAPGVMANPGTVVTVSGLIRRDSGKGSAWINGHVVAEGQAVESVGVPAIEKRHITVEGHRIRVRETVDIESGARGDALATGSVSVKKSK